MKNERHTERKMKMKRRQEDEWNSKTEDGRKEETSKKQMNEMMEGGKFPI